MRSGESTVKGHAKDKTGTKERARSVSARERTTGCERRARATTRHKTHLVDHVLELGLGGVLAKRAHDSAELLGGDGSIAVCR